MADRPMVNVYEPDAEGAEVLVYRPMDDDEYGQWKIDQEAAANAPTPPPTVAEALHVAISDVEVTSADAVALRDAIAGALAAYLP